jgi:diacylglycerol kinase (ATP)
MEPPTDSRRFRRALVLANPIAGRGSGRARAEECARGLAAIGVEPTVHFTEGRGDATEAARKVDPAVDLVVSVGGDGTLGEVLEGLAGRDVPVAIVPAGTANVMSIDLALPRDVAGLVAMIGRGRTIALDTARVNGKRLSFLVTGVGFDAMAVHEVEARRKGPITKTAYLSAGLRALRSYVPPRLELAVDGRRLEEPCALVLVSNIVHFAGLRVLAPDRRLDDGLFEVYVFAKGSRASLAGYALRALVAGLPGGSCTRLRARRVRITSDAPVACEVDGDAFGETPVELAVHPVQSRLVVP